MRLYNALRQKLISILLPVPIIAVLLTMLFGSPSGELVLVIVLVLAVVLTCWIAVNHLLIEPLCKLLNEVKSFRYGKQIKLIDTDRSHVIGHLTREFNIICTELTRLRDDLDNSYKLLDKKVVYRTSKLSKVIGRLRKTANTDCMTGLASRGYFDNFSKLLFEYALNSQTELACLMIDMDEFKSVNDNWGHKAGDNVIEFVGELLQVCTRRDDLVARYGGDEFVALLQGCPMEKAANIAETIRLHFAREVPRFANSATSDIAKPRLSIGIATLNENHPQTIEHLMRMADEALYKAKAMGRNRVVTCSSV